MALGFGTSEFNRRFEQHFEVVPFQIIDDVLQGNELWDAKATERCQPFSALRSSPMGWGMKVQFILQLWEFIKDDLEGYAAAHGVDERRQHTCFVDSCSWHHHRDQKIGIHNASGEVRPLSANMHLVVQRYVKPWTAGRGAGLALMLNAGYVAKMTEMQASSLCNATVFISHTWSEKFRDFVTTLRDSLENDTVVWVCSFAIDQHADIAGSLANVESCPFAVAMSAATRVLVAADTTAEVLSRCWVVLEAEIAQQLGKPYDISIPDNSDERAWEACGSKLMTLDVEQCAASRETDKLAILDYARRQPGGIAALNLGVREAAQKAMRNAKFLAAAAQGDTASLREAAAHGSDIDKLRTWRSIRGRSLVHIAAVNSRVETLAFIIEAAPDLLNARDANGHTPLLPVVNRGALAGLKALLDSGADVNIASHCGLTPLHFAAARGDVQSATLLLKMRANIEAEGKYRGFKRHRPLQIASLHGYAPFVSMLLQHEANVQATGADMTALHQAAYNDHTQVVSVLIAARAALDSTEEPYERTPLMLAAYRGQVATVGLLLSAHADPGVILGGYTYADLSVYEDWDAVKECAKTRPTEARVIRRLLDLSANSRTTVQMPLDCCDSRRLSAREMPCVKLCVGTLVTSAVLLSVAWRKSR